jgi:bacterioferritin-associated ferredoxin
MVALQAPCFLPLSRLSCHTTGRSSNWARILSVNAHASPLSPAVLDGPGRAGSHRLLVFWGRRQSVAAAAKAGCVTVEAIGQALQAGTNCGSCRAEIKGIINAYRLGAAKCVNRHGIRALTHF